MRVKLKQMREAAGFSQMSFAKSVGISRSHYSQIETGEKEPSLRVSLRIKKSLSYQNDDLFFNKKCPVLRH